MIEGGRPLSAMCGSSAFIGGHIFFVLLCDSVIQPAEKPKQNSMAADKRR
jgi:hypothetical protein